MTEEEKALIRKALTEATAFACVDSARISSIIEACGVSSTSFIQGGFFATVAWAHISGMTREQFVLAAGEWFDAAAIGNDPKAEH